MKYEYFLILLGVGFFLFRKKILTGLETGVSVISEGLDFVINSSYENLFKMLGFTINQIILNNKYSVSLGEVLSTIKHESGSRILSESNSSIIGDENFKYKAYGCMQVRYPALQDVNNNFGFNFSEHDLLDLENNLIAGCGYLSLCKDQAKKENPVDYTALMFQKYNAGIRTKSSSDKGKEYAAASLEYLKLFNNIV